MGRRQVGGGLRLVPVGRQGHQADGRRRCEEVRGREEDHCPRLLEGELKKTPFRRVAPPSPASGGRYEGGASTIFRLPRLTGEAGRGKVPTKMHQATDQKSANTAPVARPLPSLPRK